VAHHSDCPRRSVSVRWSKVPPGDKFKFSKTESLLAGVGCKFLEPCSEHTVDHSRISKSLTYTDFVSFAFRISTSDQKHCQSATRTPKSRPQKFNNPQKNLPFENVFDLLVGLKMQKTLIALSYRFRDSAGHEKGKWQLGITL